MTSFYNGGTSQEIFNLIGQAAALEDIIDAITAWLGTKSRMHWYLSCCIRNRNKRLI